ncbi:30S ribosomal protein S3 [bacterium]|nr:MAG: 30S ribosomal protein S3 [bacterium]
MGQKVNPIAFRLGVNKDWTSKWFSSKDYAKFLEEDAKIRKFIMKELFKMAIEKVVIERFANKLVISIFSGRPGMIIGRGGAGAEELKDKIKKLIDRKVVIEINVMEVKEPQISAPLVAEGIAAQLEKRVAFRRVMKQSIESVTQNNKIKGIKITISGRLNGAEMSRKETQSQGKIPLHTLRADIDYSLKEAHTTYGIIGVKVWIYKGEIF